MQHKRHVHKNAVLLTPGLGQKLMPCPLPGEAWDTELPLTPPLSPTPFFWEGSSTQPCPRNRTEDSGTWSNNNTQWGLLSLITQEPLPDKSQSSFWEFPQPQEASSSTFVFEIIESQVAVDGRDSKPEQSGREKHLHSPVQGVLYTGARGGKPESKAVELGSIHWWDALRKPRVRPPELHKGSAVVHACTPSTWEVKAGITSSSLFSAFQWKAVWDTYALS